jgi:membrane-associated phospholipid phosphatase
MNIILTEIGYFGPAILFLFIIYLISSSDKQSRSGDKMLKKWKDSTDTWPVSQQRLRFQQPEIYAYLFLWQAMNYALNELLKQLIKQPRPEDIAYINTWDSVPNIGQYGMPSGHAQQVFSETTFIAWAFQNPVATCISFGISMLTIYQRYVYQKHTVLQLGAGSMVGVITGSLFYIFLAHQM